jgi:threonine dehydrogenase-like Zn-dependent dehydrogenase
MRALVRRAGRVSLEDLPEPGLAGVRDVLIQVTMAGLCRTDLYVARGSLVVDEPRVLGHEMAGVVLEAGRRAGFRPGERVTVIPTLACGACAGCAVEAECFEPRFLGVDADGAFAERIVVPSTHVIGVPAGLDAKRAAYAEPVAAALAVLQAPLPREGRGLVMGDNRIAGLIRRILSIHGFSDVAGAAGAEAAAARAPFDFVIETEATAASLAAMVELLRPHGLGVLKSRPAAPVPIDIAKAVKKNLRFSAVAYGPFDRAIALLAGGALDIDELLGEAFALDDFERAFAAAEASDASKIFLSICPEPAPPTAGADALAQLAHA